MSISRQDFAEVYRRLEGVEIEARKNTNDLVALKERVKSLETCAAKLTPENIGDEMSKLVAAPALFEATLDLHRRIGERLRDERHKRKIEELEESVVALHELKTLAKAAGKKDAWRFAHNTITRTELALEAAQFSDAEEVST